MQGEAATCPSPQNSPFHLLKVDSFLSFFLTLPLRRHLFLFLWSYCNPFLFIQSRSFLFLHYPSTSLCLSSYINFFYRRLQINKSYLTSQFKFLLIVSSPLHYTSSYTSLKKPMADKSQDLTFTEFC